ncbi:uncharacterized protein [Ptychodera flava]|uniref:uncharacterized protein n=1 Tax=Ptychodera flava TaxID=63121 RepID=UPI00396AAE0A
MCRGLEFLSRPRVKWNVIVASTLLALCASSVAYDLETARFEVLSPSPAIYDVNTTLPITVSVTVTGNDFQANDTDLGDLELRVYVSDNSQLEGAIYMKKINATLQQIPDYSSLTEGEDVTFTADAEVGLSRMHCPLENYLCVEVNLENDTNSQNNDKCIKFGPQSEGKAGEKRCPESALQDDVDSGVNVVLEDLSILLWPTSSVQYRKDVSDAVNQYCQSHASECCGNYSVSNDTVDIIEPKDVLVANGYPRRIQNSLSILTFVVVKDGNIFCSNASEFRLPQNALLVALQDGKDDFEETVNRVQLGELFTEDDEATTPSPTSSPEDKGLLLRDWQIGVCVFVILLVVVGIGILVYLAMPYNEQEYVAETPILQQERFEEPIRHKKQHSPEDSKFGVVNNGADLDTVEIVERGTSVASGPGDSSYDQSPL